MPNHNSDRSIILIPTRSPTIAISIENRFFCEITRHNNIEQSAAMVIMNLCKLAEIKIREINKVIICPGFGYYTNIRVLTVFARTIIQENQAKWSMITFLELYRHAIKSTEREDIDEIWQSISKKNIIRYTKANDKPTQEDITDATNKKKPNQIITGDISIIAQNKINTQRENTFINIEPKILARAAMTMKTDIHAHEDLSTIKPLYIQNETK